MRILKKTFFFILTLLLLIVASGFLFVFKYGEEIKQFVVQNINENLKTEVKVEKIDFSVWESFPKASVVFSNVVIHAVNAKNDTLIAAKKVSAEFNLVDIYKKKYKLIGLKISDGQCVMKVDNGGFPNYEFWNKNDSSSSAFSTELEKVEISNIIFNYLDYSKDLDLSFLIEEAQLKGNLNDSLFDLEINSTLEQSNIRLGEMNLFENRRLFLFANGEVNKYKESILLNDVNLGVDEMNFALKGSFIYSDINNIDLVVSSKNTELKKAIAILPYSVRKELNRFKINGEAVFSGSISGPISTLAIPYYDFNFSISKGEFKDKNSELHFTRSFLKGNINNGISKNLSTTELTLENFESKLSQGSLEGNLRIFDFKKPHYEYNGSVNFKLKEVADLFQWKQLKNVKGIVDAEISLKGSLREIGKYELADWKNSSIKGNLKLTDLAFNYEDKPQSFKSITGNLKFNNNSLAVQDLAGYIDNTELKIKGKFNNLIGFLLEETEPLLIDAKLNSPKVDLAKLLSSNEKSQSEQDDAYELDISPRLTVYLDMVIDSLNFNKFTLSDLKGSIIVKNERIDARSITFNSQEGKFEGDLFVRENQSNQLNLYSKADLFGVNIHKLFESFNNFGQTTLKSEHISGIADLSVRFNSIWSKQLEIDPKSIEIEADLIIENGILSDFKPLESLSKFIELEELKKVEFRQIRNQILVKNEVITLPKFNLLSSAIDLSIAGTHSFNNEIDYHFSLLLNQILSKKVRKPKENEFGYVEDDGLGKSKLFLKMTGTVNDPEISYDSKELKNTLKSKIDQEKKVFKTILKDEFGLFKKDTSLKPIVKKASKSSPFQVEIDSSFLKKSKKDPDNQEDKNQKEKQEEQKSKFGKFLDKIAKPNEEEYVEPIEN